MMNRLQLLGEDTLVWIGVAFIAIPVISALVMWWVNFFWWLAS